MYLLQILYLLLVLVLLPPFLLLLRLFILNVHSLFTIFCVYLIDIPITGSDEMKKAIRKTLQLSIRMNTLKSEV